MKESIFSDVVILAGGFGERLWPASRPDYPKQFMSLSSGISFLQAAVLRAIALKPQGKIIVITRKDLLHPVSEHCANLIPQVDDADRDKIKNDLYIIAEPCARHTCAPIMLSCLLVELLDGAEKKEHTMLILASDHLIGPLKHFLEDSKKVSEQAKKGKFVCYAIPPNEPSTGYGYIKQGETVSEDGSIFKIAQFKEKPDLETAKEYIASNLYYWNSGMFAFTSSFFKEELKICEPSVYEAFDSFNTAKIPEQNTLNSIHYITDWLPMLSVYSKVPAIAVDNAIAEKTKNAVAIKASFEWDDVGSWDAFEKLFTENDGKTVEIKSDNNFVYSDIPVALCGVENLVVVIKNGSALVMKKGASGLMREVVKQIKEI